MEPSDAKAGGFLKKRITALDAVTDGEWNRCLPDEISTMDDALRRYRPAVESALSSLGSSNPREFTRLLNSLLVRAVAAREMRSENIESTPEVRFAQGAQIFLIERFLIRNLDLGPTRRNPLLNTRFCKWLEKLSAVRRAHPHLELRYTLPEDTFSESSDPTAMILRGDGPYDSEATKEIESLTASTPNARDALRILHEKAWDLLLIPFDPSIAAATATEAIVTRRTNLDTSPNSVPVRLIRRDGNVVPWSETEIEIAVKKAFLSIKEDPDPAAEVAKGVTNRVLRDNNSFVHVEDVQDMVQEELMRQGHFKAATHYVRYRNERARLRNEQDSAEDSSQTSEEKSAQIIYAAICRTLDLPEGLVGDDYWKEITELSLEGTQVSDITALKILTSLRELSLLGTQVSELSPIENLNSLQVLTLSGTKVSDLASIKNLTNLQRLFLNLSEVGDLSPLSGLTKLGLLNCNRTFVEDLTPLKNVTSLQLLDLRYTQVRDLRPLYNLKDCLKRLWVADTPAARDEDLMKALREALPNTEILG
jgi:transcriptional regulator NrdR family protein